MTCPLPSQVQLELQDIAVLIGLLKREYDFAYPCGYLGVHGQNETQSIVRHLGASDPVGYIVTSTHHQAIRRNVKDAAKRIRSARIELNHALGDLLSFQREKVS